MNYHSVNKVFSITASTGTTLSLNAAERNLKTKSSSDKCYYNTYLRKYELEYDSQGGTKQGFVSLRDCFLVFMMDNLVRLKYHSDPNPGENRSMQICTLPLTLKGVPKDASVVETWHDFDIL